MITRCWTVLATLFGIIALVSCSPPTETPPPNFLSVDSLVPGTFFTEPSFSTDGHFIAVGAHESSQQANRDGTIESFYVLDLQSQGVHFTYSGDVFKGGALSPDGTRMAVTTSIPYDDPSPSYNLFLVDISTSNISQHTRGFYPAWSPDSRYLAFFHLPDRFAANWELQLRIRDTITRQEETVFSTGVEEGYAISNLTWSLNGRMLAFTMETTKLRPDQAWPDLYVLNVENRSLQQLTANHSVYSVSFSPDGDRLLYLADSTPENPGGITLFVTDLEGRCHRVSDQPLLNRTREVALSPNGEWIAFATISSGVFVAETKDALGNGFWLTGEACE